MDNAVVGRQVRNATNEEGQVLAVVGGAAVELAPGSAQAQILLLVESGGGLHVWPVVEGATRGVQFV